MRVRQASAGQCADLLWIPAGKTTALTELVHLMREHIDKHPQDCLTIIRNATGQREEGSAERTLQRLRHSISEGKELVCWLRYVWAFCMTPRQPCSLSSTCQARLAVLAAARNTGVLHSYDHACQCMCFFCTMVSTPGCTHLSCWQYRGLPVMPGSHILI